MGLLAGNYGGFTMPHYKSNLRDLEFNLFEVFGAGDRMGRGPYHDMHVETCLLYTSRTTR